MNKTAAPEFPPIPVNKKKAIPGKELLDIMPIDLVREFRAYPFELSDETIRVAASDRTASTLIDYLKKNWKGQVEWYRALPEDIDFVLDNYSRDFREEITSLAERDDSKNGAASMLVDTLICYAFSQKTSDVHIEPSRDDMTVRFRIDGVLQKVLVLPRKIHEGVVARFKVLANLKIDESRRPQEGRIEPKGFSGALLRISTIPTLFGEKIVLRILDDANKSLVLSELGFSPDQQEILIRNVEKPFGMVVSSGPTGSGKTTTLYALLQMIRKDGINISTLEDPIEYVLRGVNQIQINPRVELSFASGLRALLRQDPDVIMVGEIRDSDTAVIAADAAMTGHLVFSTIHTNNAPSVFVRLLEMGVEDFVIASTVNFVIGQRLVRKICPSCGVEEPLSEATIKKVLNRKDIIAALVGKHGLAKDSWKTKGFKKGAGCAQCFQSGYSGRIGIYELLELTKDIHDLILSGQPSEAIREAAGRSGFSDMVEDGVSKVMNGITTLDEVIRTTRNA